MALRACRMILVAFALLYGSALLLFVIGTFGLFGSERDSLSGIFLLPLGLPWNLFLDFLPDPILAWAAASAPLVNAGLIAVLCKAFSARKR